MGYGAAVGAVAAWIAGGTAVTTTAVVTASVAVGALYGAVIGAGMSLVKGENILEGALKGAAIGGITGGIGEWVTGAAEAAAGAEAAAESAAVGGNMTLTEEGAAGLTEAAGSGGASGTGLLEQATPTIAAPTEAAQAAAPSAAPATASPPPATSVSAPVTATAGKVPSTMDYLAQMQKLSGENTQALAKISGDNIKMQMLGQGVSEAGKALAAKDKNAADEQAEAQLKLRDTNRAGNIAPVNATFKPFAFGWADPSWKALLPYAPKTAAPLLEGGAT